MYDRSNRLIAVVDVVVGPDVMTLKRRVDAANMRISAECTELRAGQYARSFQPEVTLGQYLALEREVALAKQLLLKTACVVLACLVLAGCGANHEGPQKACVNCREN